MQCSVKRDSGGVGRKVAHKLKLERDMKIIQRIYKAVMAAKVRDAHAAVPVDGGAGSGVPRESETGESETTRHGQPRRGPAAGTHGATRRARRDRVTRRVSRERDTDNSER